MDAEAKMVELKPGLFVEEALYNRMQTEGLTLEQAIAIPDNELKGIMRDFDEFGDFGGSGQFIVDFLRRTDS